ncbi:hypothetical protein EC988_000395 [Linderina pennispora]|nr:hypothetical protein EC988_000395 [Linderina pennispora]
MHIIATIALLATATYAQGPGVPVPVTPALPGPQGCAAQHVLNNCLNTQGLMLGACAYSDWACKCEAQKTIVSCFNSCPGDETRTAQEGQVKVFCNASKSVSTSASAMASSSIKADKKSAETKPTASAEDVAEHKKEKEKEMEEMAKAKAKASIKPISGQDEAKNKQKDARKDSDDAQMMSGADRRAASIATVAVGWAMWAMF